MNNYTLFLLILCIFMLILMVVGCIEFILTSQSSNKREVELKKENARLLDLVIAKNTAEYQQLRSIEEGKTRNDKQKEHRSIDQQLRDQGVTIVD